MIFNVFESIPRVHKFYRISTILKVNEYLNFGEIYDMNLKLLRPLSNYRNVLNFKTRSKFQFFEA